MAFTPQIILQDWSGGAKTDDLPDNIPANTSPNPRGIDFFGKIAQRAKGFTAFGTEADSEVGFKLYNHRILSDEEVLVKTIGTKIKFLDEVTSTWYRISTATFTAGRRWWMASFNGYMYGGNGVENFVRWRGSAWGKLQSGISIGATTIDLQSGEGARFPTSGSGLIEDDDFSWSGKTGDQLTGVTGITANHSAGARVIMALDSSTYSSNPKGSIGLFFRNRIWCNSAAEPNFWYFSKLADNTSPEDDLANFTIAGSGAGDAGFIIMPARILGARVFVTGGNEPVQVVFCADGIAYAVSVSDSGGATVGIATPFKVLGNDLGAQDLIATTENDLVVMDDKGNIRGLGYGEQSTTLKTFRLSDAIYPSLEIEDFSDGAMNYFNRTLYALGKQNESSQNNFAVVKGTNPDAFTFYDHWSLNDLAEWKNGLYGLSSINGKAYKLNDGFNADGAVYRSSLPSKQLDFNAPLVLKQLTKIRLSGFLTSNCQITMKLFLDEREVPFNWIIDGSNGNITSDLPSVAIGSVVLGRGVFGGDLPAGVSRRRFRATLLVKDIPYFYLAQLLFENAQKDVDFAIDKAVLWADSQNPDNEIPAHYIAQA